MKKLIALLFLLDSSLAMGQGTNSPCYWAGTLAKCWPLTGIYLDDNRSLRLGEDAGNGSNYVELISPASLSGNGVLTMPAATDTLVGKATTDTLTNKTIDADGTGNSITNIENADIKAAAAIERSKMADGTADHVVINSGAGAFSSEATLAMSRGGAGAALTAENGGICYSDADSLALTGAGTASMWVLSGGAGAPTMTNTTTTGKVIDGTADEIQLRIQGNATQTTAPSLFTVENSAGTDLFVVNNNGTISATANSATLERVSVYDIDVAQNAASGVFVGIPTVAGRVVTFFATAASSASTCETHCNSFEDERGMDVDSALCLGGWNAGNGDRLGATAAASCSATTSVAKNCYCMGASQN